MMAIGFEVLSGRGVRAGMCVFDTQRIQLL